jgi:phospholipid transport system substrate-binding protein
MYRRHLLVAVIAGALTPTALRAADQAEVSASIGALNDALLAAMKAGRSASFNQRFDALAPAIERAFDLQAILQTSVGVRWASLPEAQRTELMALFRKFTIASYVANFDNYSGERFEVLPELRTAGADQVVQTRLTLSKGEPIRIDYVMRESGGSWRAVDVLLNGSISRVAVQRSDFRSLLAQGDATALIASLQRKVADLSHGSLPA